MHFNLKAVAIVLASCGLLSSVIATPVAVNEGPVGDQICKSIRCGD